MALTVQLITPEKVLFSADADIVTVPGALGDFGVLPGHAPFISTIRPGVITISAEGKQQRIAVIGGIAEAVPDRCTVLAESAEDLSTITRADAQARFDQAKSDFAAADTLAEKEAIEKRIEYAEALLLAL